MAHCYTCELVARRDAGQAPLWDAILRTQYWDVVHSYNTSLRGWLVLVARRHMAAIAEMTEAEAVELGSLMRRVSLALQEVTGCVKTYVIQFAEHPDHPHVHFHIVPRLMDHPEARRSTNIFSYLGVAPEERVSEATMNEVAVLVRRILDPGEGNHLR
jgi:diadenosine tetraphosphate (Ap4A) HIT family hydrolase